MVKKLKEIDSNPHINLSELNKKDREIVLQANTGVRTKDIATSLNMHPNSVSRRKADLSKYIISYDKKLAIKCKKLRHVVIDKALLDEADPKVIKIAQDYDKMQLDRIDPVVNHSKTVNESIVAVVDLTTYK